MYTNYWGDILSDKNKRFNIWTIVPAILAVVVLIAFAVSGNITKKADEKSPTATTAVSVANEEECVTVKK